MLNQLDRIPIRYKLALTYGIQLILILLVFSLMTRVRLNQSMTTQIDQTLHVIAGQAENHVVVANNQSFFVPEIQTLNIAPAYHLYVISPQGEVWDSYNESPSFVPQNLQSTGYFNVDRSDIEDDWRVYQQALGENAGWIQVAYRTDIHDYMLSALDTELFTAVVVVSMISMVFAAFFTTIVLSPLQRITRTISNISTQNLTRRLHYSGATDEIGILANTFDTMLDRLERSIAREQQFIDNAAHELRTPLTAMKGHVDLARENADDGTNHQQVLGELDQQVTRMIKLSNDLLFLSRMQHAAMQNRFEDFDFHTYLEITVEQFASAADAKRQQLLFESEQPLSLRGDVDLLIRMVSNLLENAIKYTPSDGIITVHTAQTDAETQIMICNTGPGIAPEKIPNLFDRFFRAEDDRARAEDSIIQGTGLGLAIVKEIVTLHKGDISASSIPNEQTTFVIRLPSSRNTG